MRNWTQCSPASDNEKKILMTPKFWPQAQNSVNKEQRTHRKRPWMSVIRKHHHLPTCSSVSEALPWTSNTHHYPTTHKHLVQLPVSTYPLPSLASSHHYHHQTDCSLHVKFHCMLSNCFHFIVNMIIAMCPAAGFLFLSPKKTKKQKVAVHCGH